METSLKKLQESIERVGLVDKLNIMQKSDIETPASISGEQEVIDGLATNDFLVGCDDMYIGIDHKEVQDLDDAGIDAFVLSAYNTEQDVAQ